MRRIIFALLVVIALPSWATTYYVRTDGGPSPTCNGTADAAASAAPACAFNNPQWVLPPGFTGDGVAPLLLKAGDTLVIDPGEYEMGYGTPGASACNANYTYNCALHQTLPSGVTIEGASCTDKPVLWGTGHAYNLLDLSGSSGVTVGCLELTDHSMCINYYTPTTNTGGVTACTNNTTTESSAQDGIDISGAANVTLHDLDIHGLAQYGIMAGRLTGTTKVTNVTLRANGWGGWDGDLGGGADSSDSGTLTFTGVNVSWNGCAEAYPATTIVGCWGQNEGGYGDGFAEAKTGGTWTFTHSTFAHNAQDGLDLLYADGTGSVTVDHVTAWDNAGNGVKTAGPATLTSSVVNGYCDDWSGYPIAGDGSSGVAGTMCRAEGTAVVMEFNGANQKVTLAYNTITGVGDTLFVGGGSDYSYTPDATDVVTFSNNILLGQTSVIPKDGGGFAALDWYSDSAYAGTVNYQNNIIWNVKGAFCPTGNICKDPLLKNETPQAFDPTLLSGSPAIGTAAGSTP